MNINNIEANSNYIVNGNQLVDIRWAIGILIRRLKDDMNRYNFVPGGDCHAQIVELEKLLNDIEYSKTRLSNYFERIEF